MLNSKIKMMAVASFMALNAVAEIDGNLAADDTAKKAKLSLQLGNKGLGLTAGYQIKPWLSMHIVGTGVALPGEKDAAGKREWLNMWSVGAQPRLHMFSDAPEFYVGAHIGYAGMSGKGAKTIRTSLFEITEQENAKKASLGQIRIGLTTGYSLAISQSMGVGFNLGLFRTGKADAKMKAALMEDGDSGRQAAIKAAFGTDEVPAEWLKSNVAARSYKLLESLKKDKNEKTGAMLVRNMAKGAAYGFDMFGQRFQPAASISLDMSF